MCCAASLAAVTEMLDGDFAGRAAAVGAYFMERLKALPHVKEVRGKGLLVGVEFERPLGRAIKHGCTDRHLLVTLIGDRVIRMVPPLIVTAADCDRAAPFSKPRSGRPAAKPEPKRKRGPRGSGSNPRAAFLAKKFRN